MNKLIALCAIALLLSACNTMEGFGKDIKRVGQKVESAASK